MCIKLKVLKTRFLKSIEFLYLCISAPVNCQWSNWSAWGSCSKSCGGGTQKSTRSKTVQESDDGTCSGLSEKSQSCNSQGCPSEFSYIHITIQLATAPSS